MLVIRTQKDLTRFYWHGHARIAQLCLKLPNNTYSEMSLRVLKHYELSRRLDYAIGRLYVKYLT